MLTAEDVHGWWFGIHDDAGIPKQEWPPFPKDSHRIIAPVAGRGVVFVEDHLIRLPSWLNWWHEGEGRASILPGVA